jgi:hypothetical protein
LKAISLLSVIFIFGTAVAQERSSAELDKSVCQFDVIELTSSIPEGAVVPRGARGHVVYSCSGAVVGPRHFFLGAHCVDALKTRRGGVTRLGRVYCDSGKDVHFVQPRDARPHRNWDSTKRGKLGMARYDIALVATGEDFTVPALIMPSGPDELKTALEHNKCGMFSFGGRRYDRGQDVRRFPLPIMKAETRAALAAEKQILDDPGIIYTSYGDFLVGGDSGGPLICINPSGLPLLVGVASRGKTLELQEEYVNIATSILPVVSRTQARNLKRESLAR